MTTKKTTTSTTTTKTGFSNDHYQRYWDARQGLSFKHLIQVLRALKVDTHSRRLIMNRVVGTERYLIDYYVKIK